MDEIAVDPNDLIRQFELVSLSQRSLFADCERQRNRLVQLLRLYDHQQTARKAEFRRQYEQINKATRNINSRSKTILKERDRLKHILDNDDENNRTELYSSSTSRSYFQINNGDHDRKRKTYGCLLTQFKGPTTKSVENWLQFKSNTTLTDDEYKKQRRSTIKSIQSDKDQRNRMNNIIDKCLIEFEQCDGLGYDHYLQTSEPNRNAQILAQQINNEK